jgi:Dihydroxyacetone kinase
MIKKILNNPKDVVVETTDGLILAYHGDVEKIENSNAIKRTKNPPR